MASTTYYLKGKLAWAHRLFTPDDAFGVRQYKVDLYPDDDSLEILRKSGSQVRVKTDEKGKKISLKRDVARDFKDGKGPVDLPPPKILKSDMSPWTDEDPMIGNGTEATVRIVVYDAGRYKGTRLEAVRVDNLVEYKKPTDGADPSGADTPEDLPF